jgi:tetratricopeptide (TPR) repeat protein
LTFATPYRNVRPEVRYVGDAECVRCHRPIAESYARHPMGRSLAPLAEAAPVERYERSAGNPFEAFGLLHGIEQRGQRTIHYEARLRGDGRPVARAEADIQFVLGSGTRGRAYLIENEGRLFQSSASWYVTTQKWALPPGYQDSDRHFDRPITPECLACHGNRADAVPHAVNAFRKPIFKGYAIGCERCHGPGELHVRTSDRLDIVDPKRLAPPLRDSVCEQCHLSGVGRILRRGRGLDDFRPGLPLHLFWSVFVKKDRSGGRKLLSHAEAMHESRCYQKSDGELGCISCHDPHFLPTAAERVSYYRGRCLECHGQKGCSLALAERQTKQDSCMACHMTSVNPTDVAHVTIADHSIPRTPDAAGNLADLVPSAHDHVPVVHFHRALAGPADEDVSRELGIVLSDLSRLELNREYARLALPMLDRAIEADQADVRALEARGCALWIDARYPEALATFDKALAVSPDEETTLVNAGTLATSLGRFDRAVGYWERVLALNPWPAGYHYEMARVRVSRGEWNEAIRECDASVRRNVAHLDARRLLIDSLLQSGDRARAERELDVLLGFDPPDAEALRGRITGRDR